LEKERQLDLMAYWQITKEATAARWLTSGPATLRDLYDILATSKGKAPRRLFEDLDRKPIDPSTRRNWQERTGSTPAAISWWTG